MLYKKIETDLKTFNAEQTEFNEKVSEATSQHVRHGQQVKASAEEFIRAREVISEEVGELSMESTFAEIERLFTESGIFEEIRLKKGSRQEPEQGTFK